MADVAGRPGSTLFPRTGLSIAKRPVLSAWLALAAFLAACWSFGISPYSDADDLLKFAKIRAFLEKGRWFDQSLPGILQPEQFHSHWPRILDLPCALLAWAAEPLIGEAAALKLAAFAIPLLLLFPALALYRKVMAALGFERPEPAFFVSLMLAMPAFFEFAPGRIDYHNVQMLFLLAVVALTFTRSGLAAAANGAVIALALATSIEFALFFGLAMAVYAVEFIADAEKSERRLGFFGAALAGMALLVYPVIVAPGSYRAVACDSYSAPHLLALLFAGTSFAAAAIAGRKVVQPLPRAALIAVPGIYSLLLLARLFPECLAGPYAGLSPYLRQVWFVDIGQERSLFGRPDFVLSASMVSVAMAFVGATAPALVAVFDRCRDHRLVIFALFALLAMAQAILYFRYLRYLSLFAGPGLLLAASAIIPSLRKDGGLLAGRFGSSVPPPFVMLAPGLLVSAALVIFHLVTPAPAYTLAATSVAGSCYTDAIEVGTWPQGARIMAPPDIGIELLPDLSGAAVVAVPFHTGTAGLDRVYRFLDPATGDPRAILDDSLATHVVVCAWRGQPSPVLEARYPFAAELMEGKAPEWLSECLTSNASPVRIYRYPAVGGAASTCPLLR
jgi:hypothetical protein